MKERIIFWYGVDYTPFCLSYQMKKIQDFDAYAIIDVTNKPKSFFQNQDIVHLKKKWFFHDHIQTNIQIDFDYLSSFERKYNVNLWKLVLNERIFLYYKFFHKFSYDEILSIVQSECKLFEEILSEIKPTFFITKPPALHHLQLFYEMCRNTGIRVIILNLSNIAGNMLLTEDPDKPLDTWNDKSYKFNDADLSKTNILQNYLEENRMIKQVELLTKPVKKKSQFVDILNFIKSDNKNTKTHYTYLGRNKIKVMLYYMSEAFKTKYRSYFINRNLISEPNLDTPFVYYPLHTEIERALLISSPFYTNQIEIIKIISKSIPINYKLIVKEHPFQKTRSWRSISDYNEILQIPNVELVHPDFNAINLYEKCSLVITISGHSGFEALFYKKPVITMVETNYSNLSGVHKLSNFDNLPSLIQNIIGENINQNDLNRYIANLENNSSNFHPGKFIKKFENEVFSGSGTVDMSISDEVIKLFLERNVQELNVLALDVLKKIDKNSTLNSN